MQISTQRVRRTVTGALVEWAGKVDPRLWAALSIVLWLAFVSLVRPEPFMDEGDHLTVIRGMAEGELRPPEALPLLPGYHWLMAGLSAAFSPSLTIVRALTALISLFAVLAYAAAMRGWHGGRPQREVLLFAWMPLLFPFTAMVYTDITALLGVVAALWAHVQRRYGLAALALGLACAVRQSTVVWALFFLAWLTLEMLEGWKAERNRRGMSARAFLLERWLPLAWPYLLTASGWGLVMLTFGINFDGLKTATSYNNQILQHQNSPGINLAHLYVLALFTLGLWAPLWLERAPADLAALRRGLTREGRGTAIGAFLVGLVGMLLILTYDNPHAFNDHERFVRNLPLILMDRLPLLRVGGVLALLLAGWLVYRFWREQPFRWHLLLVGVFTALFLAPQQLVEPRYYVVPFVLFNFFAVFSVRQQRRLIAWYLTLIALASMLVAAGGLW